MGVLVFIEGGKELQQTYNNVDDGMHNLLNIRDGLHSSINSTIHITNEMKGPFLSEFLLYFNDNCTEIQDVASTFIDSLSFYEETNFTHLWEFEAAFEETLFPLVDNIQNGVISFQKYAKIFYFAWPLYFMGFVLALGTSLAFTFDQKALEPDPTDIPPIRDPRQECIPRYFYVHRWVIIPLYFASITIFFIVSASSGTLLLSNAEFCLGYGSPTGFVEAVVNSSEIEGIKREVLDYYVFNVSFSFRQSTDYYFFYLSSTSFSMI
jgi:hypothetical protein